MNFWHIFTSLTYLIEFGRKKYFSIKNHKAKYSLASIFLLAVFILLPILKGQANSAISAEKIINLTNQARLQNDLPTLKVDYLLTEAAENKAQAIIKNQFFAHDQLDGKKFSEWVKDEDYHYLIVGENLAMGFSSNEAIMNAWMLSPMHKENILKQEYQDIGLAAIKGKMNGQETYIIVQYFGKTNNSTLSENLRLYFKGSNQVNNLIDLT